MAYENVIEKKIGELHRHQEEVIRDLIQAFESVDEESFVSASDEFETNKCLMGGLEYIREAAPGELDLDFLGDSIAAVNIMGTDSKTIGNLAYIASLN